nr:MAG TPA: hypothetical protein [Caudoviricetes sp.]
MFSTHYFLFLQYMVLDINFLDVFKNGRLI